MTKQKHLKELVRARMSKTGESYTAARRQVVAARPADGAGTGGYTLRGGTHPETAALANTLANAGVTIGGEQVSEELILWALATSCGNSRAIARSSRWASATE